MKNTCLTFNSNYLFVRVSPNRNEESLSCNEGYTQILFFTYFIEQCFGKAAVFCMLPIVEKHKITLV